MFLFLKTIEFSLFFSFKNLEKKSGVQSPESRVQSPESSPESSPAFILCQIIERLVAIPHFPFYDILSGKTKILTVSLIFNTTNEANLPETLGKKTAKN